MMGEREGASEFKSISNKELEKGKKKEKKMR